MKLYPIRPERLKYGAPMGRTSYGFDHTGRLHVSRVHLDSGGYDPGGAYWGHSLRLYGASDTPVGDTPSSAAFATVRAKNRAEAVRMFRTLFPNSKIRG